MKRFYLLSVVLAAQVLCFVAEDCFANTENLSEQLRLGKDVLGPDTNKD